MEKRLFLAVLLSFSILFLWTSVFPPPKKSLDNQVSEVSVPSSNGAISVSDSVESLPLSVDQKTTEADKSLQTIENKYLAFEFSNVGGVIESASILKYDHSMPVRQLFGIAGYDKVVYNLDKVNESEVVYSYKDENVSITKSYSVSLDKYFVESEIQVENISKTSKQLDLNVNALQLDISEADLKDKRASMLMEYSYFSGGVVERKKTGSKFQDKNNIVLTQAVDWVGFRDQYYCTIVKPTFEVVEYSAKRVDEKRLNVSLKPGSIQLDPGQKTSLGALIYYGPQDMARLEGYEQSFERIISYKIGGFFDIMGFGLTDYIAKAMLNTLNFIHKIIPNWGINIIIFAIIIFSITYPLTRKSMLSMKRMQAIQPKVAALKEKHPNNPQKQQQEMMELYKKEKVNPFGGCLPIFIQMPIFISLYQLLWRSYAFKGASFLWIKDLSEPDRLFHLPFDIPYLGNEFNILPIIYAGLMFLQQRFQAKNVTVTDKTQADMQKMMSKFFPIMLGLVFYKFASGLTLYFTIYYLLTTVSQWKMSKETGGAARE